MAVVPTRERIRPEAARLAPFDDRFAQHVLSWVGTPREEYWLAPRTRPPLTISKLLAWSGAGHRPMMLVTPEYPEPLAYGEVNVLNEKRREYWLGHLIVDRQRRGSGLGRRLTELLLLHAFGELGARRVSLVVFPENAAAVACYRSAGMHADGHEIHSFAAYRRRERLLRMVATRAPKLVKS
jgi:RimJ/RimL family protein N-acetyltransferase